MSGYVKELLIDMARGTVDTETRADLHLAIQAGLKSGIFTEINVIMLELYISGYTSEEIARKYNVSSEGIDSLLERMFKAIETISDYQDYYLYQKIFRNNQLTKEQQNKIKNWITEHGTEFRTHEMPKVRILTAKKEEVYAAEV